MATNTRPSPQIICSQTCPKINLCRGCSCLQGLQPIHSWLSQPHGESTCVSTVLFETALPTVALWYHCSYSYNFFYLCFFAAKMWSVLAHREQWGSMETLLSPWRAQKACLLYCSGRFSVRIQKWKRYWRGWVGQMLGGSLFKLVWKSLCYQGQPHNQLVFFFLSIFETFFHNSLIDINVWCERYWQST